MLCAGRESFFQNTHFFICGRQPRGQRVAWVGRAPLKFTLSRFVEINLL